jgi:FkbM family methyltransferase
MYTPRIQSDPKLTKFLVAQRAFESSPVGLVDVGASGGIDYYWNVFGRDLRAVGFDPLSSEVERLNSLHPNGNQKYYAHLVGSKQYDELLPASVRDGQSNLFERTSAARTQALTRCNYARDHYDQTGIGSMSQEMVELDEFVSRTHPMDVDFIKIDTDGHDYEVLLGAQKLLRQCPVMGVAVECQFHGLLHEASNTFANIDRLLRGLGFSLFDMEVYRYSRAALPKPFVYRIPAQTHAGQVLWADTLYLRDAAEEDYEQSWSQPLSAQKLLKLACFMEMFGIEDCSAELLLQYRERLQPLFDVRAALDLLTPELAGEKRSYAKFQEHFEKDPHSLYPPK